MDVLIKEESVPEWGREKDYFLSLQPFILTDVLS